jgi:hypothetical protein
MRTIQIVALGALLACGQGAGTSSESGGDVPGSEAAATSPPAAAGDAPASASDGSGAKPGSGDPYADVYAAVDSARMTTILKEMTGYAPVTIDGTETRIRERYTPASKALWRKYFTQYYTALGATVNEVTFPVRNLVGETIGHDMEAVFPGQSKDTIVAIVHYDSTGVDGHEAENPAVDDNMTPMAIQMEAARVLAKYKGRLQHTVRFVATDYEEITTLEGGKAYVSHLQSEASANGFAIVAAIDGELSGWSCWKDGKCGNGAPAANMALSVVTCTGDKKANYPALAKQMSDLTAKYSPMRASLECDDDTDGSELYNFWRIGVPALYFEEYEQDSNDHFDENGGDTLDRIDLDYFAAIGRIGAVYVSSLVGIAP